MIGREVRFLLLLVGMSSLTQPVFAAQDFASAARLQSREDAYNLARLAPPGRSSTAKGTYGDAALARTHVRAHRPTAVRDKGADAPLGLYVCSDRVGRSARKLCVRDPRRVGFRDFYIYSPAYATAPQVPRDGLGREPSLLPPATDFFYSANVFLFGNPAGSQ